MDKLKVVLEIDLNSVKGLAMLTGYKDISKIDSFEKVEQHHIDSVLETMNARGNIEPLKASLGMAILALAHNIKI